MTPRLLSSYSNDIGSTFISELIIGSEVGNWPKTLYKMFLLIFRFNGTIYRFKAISEAISALCLNIKLFVGQANKNARRNCMRTYFSEWKRSKTVLLVF